MQAKHSKLDQFSLWLLILVAALPRVVLAVQTVKTGLFDDAYVSLRYASNLVAGLGFVFNRGERVLGTTSPLNVAILAIITRFFGVSHLEAIAVALGVAASLATIFFSKKLIAQGNFPAEVTWTFLCILAFLPSILVNTTSGMETPLVALLMVLSLLLETQDRMVSVAAISVLLMLVRIDTGVWLVCLGICIVVRYGRARFNELLLPLLIFLFCVTSWFAFSKIYFGSVIPESIIGKALNHGAFETPNWHFALTVLSAYFPVQRFGNWGWFLISICTLGLAPGTADLWKNYPHLRTLILFFPLYVGAFIASKAPMFSWYEIPAKWAFYLIAVYGIWWWVRRGQLWVGSLFLARSAMAVLAVFIIGLGIATVGRAAQEGAQDSWPKAASTLIDNCVKEDGRIFVEHIGYIGFKTGRYIYDPGGLVTPRTNALKREYKASWLKKGLKEYQADVVMLYSPDVALMQSESDPDTVWFESSYIHVRDFTSNGFVVSVYFLKSSKLTLDCNSK